MKLRTICERLPLKVFKPGDILRHDKTDNYYYELAGILGNKILTRVYHSDGSLWSSKIWDYRPEGFYKSEK